MATDGAAAVTAVRSYHNYSLHAIVAAYGLALVPHGYYTYRMTRVAPKGKTSNLMCVLPPTRQQPPHAKDTYINIYISILRIERDN